MRKVQQYGFYWIAAILVWALACQKEIQCPTCNKLPVANAGSDQAFILPKDSTNLDGSASADADGKIVSWLWTKLSGPAGMDILNANTAVATVNKLVAGHYAFELKVTDNQGAAARDTVAVVVGNQALNRPPVAHAGSDQSFALPKSTTTLDGSWSTDPDQNITSYAWSLVSGPSAVSIAQANAITTQVSGLAEGAYLFALQVRDAGGLLATDTVQVQVNPPAPVLNCGAANRQVINTRLVPFARLSEPGSGMAVAAAGDVIAFAGATLSGTAPNYGSATVHLYHINTQTWSEATLSAWRADVAIIAAGNKLFFAGGRLGSGGRLTNGASFEYFSTVDIYDVATNKWSVAHLSQARAYIAAATVGDKVFFAGGEQEWPRPVSDRVDIYDLATGTWSTTSLHEPRNGMTAVAANNKVYFAGGSNQLGGVNNVTNIIDVYDDATGSWRTSTLSEPKAFAGAIHVAGKIFWAGGFDGAGNPTCKVEVRDMATQTSTGAFLFHPFSYVTHQGQNTVIKDNKIIWFAAIDPLNGNTTDRFNIYDLTTATWSIGLLPFPISGASIISVNNTVYVAGGSINGKLTDQVWKLEF